MCSCRQRALAPASQFRPLHSQMLRPRVDVFTSKFNCNFIAQLPAQLPAAADCVSAGRISINMAGWRRGAARRACRDTRPSIVIGPHCQLLHNHADVVGTCARPHRKRARGGHASGPGVGLQVAQYGDNAGQRGRGEPGSAPVAQGKSRTGAESESERQNCAAEPLFAIIRVYNWSHRHAGVWRAPTAHTNSFRILLFALPQARPLTRTERQCGSAPRKQLAPPKHLSSRLPNSFQFNDHLRVGPASGALRRRGWRQRSCLSPSGRAARLARVQMLREFAGISDKANGETLPHVVLMCAPVCTLKLAIVRIDSSS